MNWNNLADFIDMGGYALYVWGSYGFCILALVWEAVILMQRRQRATDEVRQWRALEDESLAASPQQPLRRPNTDPVAIGTPLQP